MLLEALARSVKIMIWNFQILGYSPRSSWWWLLLWLFGYGGGDTQNQRRRYVASLVSPNSKSKCKLKGQFSYSIVAGRCQRFCFVCFTFQNLLILRFFSFFNLCFETPRPTLGSSCSPAKDNLWRLIFLGDPIHWDPSVLTLEFEGSFEPSMQVRRLAFKCMNGIMRWQASNCEKISTTLVWMTEPFQVCLGLSSDSCNTSRMDLKFGWDLPSWLRWSRFWWYCLAWF